MLLAVPLALAGDSGEGVLVRGEDGGAHLELRASDAQWTPAPGATGADMRAGEWYWLPQEDLPASIDELELRMVSDTGMSAATQVQALDFDLDLDVGLSPLIATDTVPATLSVGDPLAGASGSVGLQISLRSDQGAGGDEQGWLSAVCGTGDPLDACLVPDVESWPVDELGTPVTLPAWAAVHARPAVIDLQAVLWVNAIGPDGSALSALAAETTGDSLLSMGRSLYWGDLHAHSNLSYDGCELEDEACDSRGGTGGQDFFEQAAAVDLDFVAMSEHAEWGRYYPSGLGGDSIDIWEEQQRLVQAADAVEGGPLPLLGYEWTNWRSRPVDTSTDYEGGHKSVIFQETSVDPDFRISAGRSGKSVTKGHGVYVVGDSAQTSSPVELTALLDAAAAAHGGTPVITFFHHPAWEAPQGVDFGNPINAPNPRYEMLVEIYSEHGSSECIDLDVEDCGFQSDRPGVSYLPRGSAQFAIKMGYHLGFIAGTDSHDARPGSWEDGPGAHATTGEDFPEPRQQFAPGGITGALVPGELTRASLFSSLTERATVASSGPRPQLRVLAIDGLGRPWLPGALLPADAGSLRIVAHVQADGFVVERIALIDRTGAMVTEMDGGDFDQTVAVAGDEAWVLRVVLTDGADSHRVWVSPFFTGPADDGA